VVNVFLLRGQGRKNNFVNWKTLFGNKTRYTCMNRKVYLFFIFPFMFLRGQVSNYNTEAVTCWENEVKLPGSVSDEEIIREIEEGNVSLLGKTAPVVVRNAEGRVFVRNQFCLLPERPVTMKVCISDEPLTNELNYFVDLSNLSTVNKPSNEKIDPKKKTVKEELIVSFQPFTDDSMLNYLLQKIVDEPWLVERKRDSLGNVIKVSTHQVLIPDVVKDHWCLEELFHKNKKTTLRLHRVHTFVGGFGCGLLDYDTKECYRDSCRFDKKYNKLSNLIVWHKKNSFSILDSLVTFLIEKTPGKVEKEFWKVLKKSETEFLLERTE
jgi:hypothetical protein